MGKSRGVIAAGHELTAQSAEAVLLEGGNAFDAVLAALATACVAEPVLASLGGGGYLLARPAGDQARVYDFFVQTPRKPRPESELDFRPILADFGTAQQEFHIGNGSAAVPGVVRGMFEVHRELGSMPMPEIVASAVEHAKKGVATNALHAYVFSVVGAIYVATPAAAAIYGRGEGDEVGLPVEGDVLRHPALADVLETLAVEGDDLFYRGEIARTIVTDMAAGGQLAAEDLARYQVERRAPLGLTYKGVRLATNPPPSAGGQLNGFSLALLEALAGPAGGEDFRAPERLAKLVQVMDLAAQARLEARLDEIGVHPALLRPEFIAAYQALAASPPSRGGTTHISIIDGRGNVASLSVSNGEGCGYVVPGTGIMLNNMLGEQDLNPRGFHLWPADVRMSSMMAPTLVVLPDGTTVALGSGGSNRIRTAILQVLLNLIDFGMDVSEAVNAPRIHYEEGLLSIEGGFDPERLTPLLEAYPKHHLWPDRNLFFGGTHTVAAREGGEFRGAGDPRRGGVSITVNS